MWIVGLPGGFGRRPVKGMSRRTSERFVGRTTRSSSDLESGLHGLGLKGKPCCAQKTLFVKVRGGPAAEMTFARSTAFAAPRARPLRVGPEARNSLRKAVHSNDGTYWKGQSQVYSLVAQVAGGWVSTTASMAVKPRTCTAPSVIL